MTDARVAVEPRPLAPDGRALALIVVGVAAAAWVALAVASADGAHNAFSHHHLERTHLDALGPVVLGWAIMVVAMMLPPALPMLDVVRRLVRRHRHRQRLVALAAFAFVALWTVVGIALVVADIGVHEIAERVGWLSRHPGIVPGLVFVGAGLYQFSPLKNACLRACRSPQGFAFRRWRGERRPGVEIMALTGDYALSCIGCCWALMAISFALGAASLAGMVVLTVVMTAERLVSWGPRLVRPVGVLSVALGLAALAGLAPAGLLPS